MFYVSKIHMFQRNIEITNENMFLKLPEHMADIQSQNELSETGTDYLERRTKTIK